MQYSKTLQSLPPQYFSSLVHKVNKAKAEGKDVINLGQGNPDQPAPEKIVDELNRSSRNPASHKYSPFRGKDSFKKAIRTFYHHEYGVSLDLEKEIAILFGGKSGLIELPICFCNKGDLVLVPDPGYPDYLSGIAMASATPYFLPLMKERNYLPDYQSVPADISEKARLLFLNYPNNPTGACATMPFFEETASYCAKNGIIPVHDFAYGAIGFDGQKPPSFMQAGHAKDVGIEIYTMSKTFNMAGWRVGFAVGNSDVIEAINLLQDHMYVSIFPAIQDAASIALSECNGYAAELVNMYEDRRNTFMDACRQIGWHGNPPPGSFFVWMPVADGFSSEAFADLLLQQADVAVAPGSGFGAYGEGFVRIGLVESKERLLEAVNRIGKLGIFTDRGQKTFP
ncbi:pyridoxal phosphate-dependent aminotransferase [Bacillus testis]|uniref:pyridoxal phosphate-dependent aminotransferase n=1 Tax=Bacillus testis TaxID=1622072 RepID=UPI00067F530A|nr:pyridoxal phosphate-dependent aminotransferase [Bacillus testis]